MTQTNLKSCLIYLSGQPEQIHCMMSLTSAGFKNFRGEIGDASLSGVNVKAAFTTLSEVPDSSVNYAAVEMTLEFYGSAADRIKEFFGQLRRVLVDGALIRFYINYPATYTAASVKSSLDSAFALLGVNGTCSIDADLEYSRMVPAASAMAVQALAGRSFNGLSEVTDLLIASDNALQSLSCYLIFNRDKNFRYALATPMLATGNSPVESYGTALDPAFVMSVYDPGEESMYASRNIINVGYIEPHETRMAEVLIRMFRDHHSSFIVANIGANLGWYSLLAARMFTGVRVDAFEPAPQSLRMLKNTVAINNLEHAIAVHEVALSDDRGSVDFYVYESNAGGNSVVHFAEGNDKDYARYEKITVPCDTLDSVYLSQEQSQWPKLVIMDAEGHEQKILDGARELFNQGFRPALLVEFSPALLTLRGQCRYHYELIEKYNYRAFALTEGRLSPVSADDLRAFYDKLCVNNPNSSHLDLLFIPMDKFVIQGTELSLK